MAKFSELKNACQLGMECRRAAKIGGREFANQFLDDSDEHDAWRAGYENDLVLWNEVRDRADPEPVKRCGRLKSMEPVVFNAHTSRPDFGYFLGYDHCPKGMARVLLGRGGTTKVPTIGLTRREKAEVAA